MRKSPIVRVEYAGHHTSDGVPISVTVTHLDQSVVEYTDRADIVEVFRVCEDQQNRLLYGERIYES